MQTFSLETQPNDWELRPLGDCCEMVSKSCHPSDADGRPYLGLEHLASGFPKLVAIGDPAEVRSTKTMFRERDVLYGKLRPYLRKAVLASFDGICSTDIIVMRTKDLMIPEFLSYVLHADQFTDRAKATTSGVNHPRTSWSKLKPFKLPVPPQLEQRRIAAVLALIRSAIEQRDQAIALSSDLKNAVMRQLFTKGASNDPRKETEVGRIPAAWTVLPLADIAESMRYGTSVKCDYNADGVPVLRIPNVVGGRVDVTDLKFGKPKANHLDRLRLQHGDLLFVRTNGVQENAGRCSMYRGELGNDCYFASYLIRVRTRRGQLLPRFLDAYTRTETGKSFLSGRAIRTADGKFNINSGTLKQMLVPIPPLEEQKEIIRMLDVFDRKIALHEGERDALDSLFRTLLNDFMTARVRVSDLDLTPLGLDVPEHEGVA